MESRIENIFGRVFDLQVSLIITRGFKKENLWYRPLWSVGQKRKKGKKNKFSLCF